MKQLVVLVMVGLLFACSNAEMEKELADLKASHEALKSKATEYESRIPTMESQIKALEEVKTSYQALQEEAATLREKHAEAETQIAALEPKAAKVPELEKGIAELKTKLQQASVPAERLAFLAKQCEGVKARIVTNMGAIEVAFKPEVAPLHVFNFVARAESGFFDNTQFHRVIPGFMIQGGDHLSSDMNFNDDGSGAPIVAIPHEFNQERHKRGVLSMARRSDPRYGAGSQFFIMHADAPQLDRQYTVFGEVTSGMDVVDRIAATKRNRRDHPLEPVWIEKVEVRR